MAIVLGLDAKLYRNTAVWATPTWSLIDNVMDLTLNVEKGDADVSTRGSGGWRQHAVTLKDGSIEFEMVWDTADAEFTALKDAFFNDTTVECAAMDLLIATSGSQGLHADFNVGDFSRSEALEDALKVSVNLTPARTAYTPEWLEIP